MEITKQREKMRRLRRRRMTRNL